MTKYTRIDLKKIAEIEENPDHAWQVYLAALYYVQCGFYLIPIIKNGKKLPKREYRIKYTSASNVKSKIEEWFNAESGIFRGWNIGIATGKNGGVFALDIDRHGTVDGFDSLDLLEQEYETLPEAPTQVTPRGGQHRLFEWKLNAGNSTGKIGPGLDTRGGDEKQCKGHIVVWPSTVEGKQYKWEFGGYPAEIPEWVMTRLGVAWKSGTKASRGNENVTEDDLEKIIEPEQIRRMLTFISADDMDYEAWLKVGMSIKSQCPDEEGLTLWDEWSSSGERYAAGECNIRWNGFSDTGSVRAGTLFYFAKQGGWEPDFIKKESGGNEFDTLVAELNTEYAIISLGGKIRILREKEPENPMMPHFDFLGKEDFKTLLMNEKVWVEDRSGNPKPLQVADIWLGHPYRRQFPNGIGLFPSGAKEGFFNTWNGFAVEPKQGGCSLFLALLKDVICSGEELHYEWTLDWLADLFQFPDSPKGVAIVMRGDEGIGKGTFANTIGEMFGPHFKHITHDEHLTGNFNAHLMDALVVFADEITWGGNRKTAGTLKGMVTEEYLVGTRKGIDALFYKNMVHMLIAGNDDWLIPAGESSRRWFALDVSNEKASNAKYFGDIKEEQRNGGREALLHMLLSREITHNLRLAPITEALLDQRCMSASGDSLANWWTRMLMKEMLVTPDESTFEPGDEDLSWPEYVTGVSLFEEYEQWCFDHKQIPLQVRRFVANFSKMADAKNTRIKVKGVYKRVLRIPSLKVCTRMYEKTYGKLNGDDDE